MSSWVQQQVSENPQSSNYMFVGLHTNLGHPLFPAPSLLSNQYKFETLLVEDPSGNDRTEYSMKMDLPNQLFSSSALL